MTCEGNCRLGAGYEMRRVACLDLRGKRVASGWFWRPFQAWQARIRLWSNNVIDGREKTPDRHLSNFSFACSLKPPHLRIIKPSTPSSFPLHFLSNSSHSLSRVSSTLPPSPTTFAFAPVRAVHPCISSRHSTGTCTASLHRIREDNFGPSRPTLHSLQVCRVILVKYLNDPRNP